MSPPPPPPTTRHRHSTGPDGGGALLVMISHRFPCAGPKCVRVMDAINYLAIRLLARPLNIDLICPVNIVTKILKLILLSLSLGVYILKELRQAYKVARVAIRLVKPI